MTNCLRICYRIDVDTVGRMVRFAGLGLVILSANCLAELWFGPLQWINWNGYVSMYNCDSIYLSRGYGQISGKFDVLSRPICGVRAGRRSLTTITCLLPSREYGGTLAPYNSNRAPKRHLLQYSEGDLRGCSSELEVGLVGGGAWIIERSLRLQSWKSTCLR